MYNTKIKGTATNFKTAISSKETSKKLNLNLFSCQPNPVNLNENIFISLTSRKLVIAMVPIKTNDDPITMG